MFSTGVYFKIWNVSNKGNYSEVECSTSKLNKQTQKYETDFSSKFVRFIGEAHRKNPQPNEKIKVTSCGVQNVYESNGQKQYLKNPTYIVFDFERDANTNALNPSDLNGVTPKFVDFGTDEELPF